MNKKTLTKADLTESLFAEIGLSKQNSKELIERVFETIVSALEKGEDVKLSRFGRFYLKDKKGRPGRDPRTKRSFPVSPRRVVTFKPCQGIKRMIEKYTKTTARRKLLDEKTE